MKKLKSIDHSFGINLWDINIKPEDIEKVQQAWSEGHYIYKDINGWDFEHIGVEIFTVTSKNGVYKGAEEITGSWNDISGMLKNNELPNSWVDEAILKVSNRMEELL